MRERVGEQAMTDVSTQKETGTRLHLRKRSHIKNNDITLRAKRRSFCTTCVSAPVNKEGISSYFQILGRKYWFYIYSEYYICISIMEKLMTMVT